ncbi:MAG: methionine ABC transporter ATP-binding protein [Firmicutes bacterium HGW-Firmicutes-8]|nr:MAG: methionine ABC transporter ATP-binding protein [Firmicutes bacterium HGW-Firmicutes-8]
MEEAALRVKNLSTHFYTPRGIVKAVNGISFQVKRGQVLGLVGESGCGKSITSLSILRLVPTPGKIVGGVIYLNGKNLLQLPKEEMRRVRGKEMAMIFQDPMTSFNPVRSIGRQFIETILAHMDITKEEAWNRAVEMLAKVGLPAPEKVMRQYPFQLSGGMRQRAMIAIALALNPKVLIADEPTTALDVTIQAQILAEMRRLKDEFGTGILLITHDLGVIAQLADEVAVMYAGSIMEYGSITTVFETPAHPYTRALLNSIPRLDRDEGTLKPVKGQPPSLLNLKEQCPFLPRCDRAGKLCSTKKPLLTAITPAHRVACNYPLSTVIQEEEVSYRELACTN